MPEQEDVKSNEFDSGILADLLPLYYKRVFPHDLFYKWLSYLESESFLFINREISFTLENDVYIRYLSFEDKEELKKEICDRNPLKIDIGAVMSVRPKHNRSSSTMQPVQRELVFDIDMTDYDLVRTCCEGTNVCQKCWKFMVIACRVLDSALREDFGFESIFWVFSGRRGIHCWVCDKMARQMNMKVRAAVAEYLQLVTHGGENGITKVTIGDKIHHSIKRSLKIIQPIFEEICINDQNLFMTEKGLNQLLQMVYDEQMRKELENQLKSLNSSKSIWEAFVKYFNSLKIQGNLNRRYKHIEEEVQLALLYPRLDINVTKGLNHLLKSPFCVHPKTGKICVPFNPNTVSKFDPCNVPTINELLDEINTFDQERTEEGNGSMTQSNQRSKIYDYKKTRMANGAFVFEEFLRKLELHLNRNEIIDF